MSIERTDWDSYKNEDGHKKILDMLKDSDPAALSNAYVTWGTFAVKLNDSERGVHPAAMSALNELKDHWTGPAAEEFFKKVPELNRSAKNLHANIGTMSDQLLSAGKQLDWVKQNMPDYFGGHWYNPVDWFGDPDDSREGAAVKLMKGLSTSYSTSYDNMPDAQTGVHFPTPAAAPTVPANPAPPGQPGLSTPPMPGPGWPGPGPGPGASGPGWPGLGDLGPGRTGPRDRGPGDPGPSWPGPDGSAPARPGPGSLGPGSPGLGWPGGSGPGGRSAWPGAGGPGVDVPGGPGGSGGSSWADSGSGGVLGPEWPGLSSSAQFASSGGGLGAGATAAIVGGAGAAALGAYALSRKLRSAANAAEAAVGSRGLMMPMVGGAGGSGSSTRRASYRYEDDEAWQSSDEAAPPVIG